MANRIFNVTGNVLNDSSLNVGIGTSETVNVFGNTEMEIAAPGGGASPVTVNLQANSKWIGGFTEAPFSSITVHGPGVFNNLSSTVNGSAIIGANVVGSGTFNVEAAHSSGKLEFMHSVSAGQTVTVSAGYYVPNQISVLQVDSPSTYHASNILGYGEIILDGLKATSYALQNDLLTLFNGNQAIYGTRLSEHDDMRYGVTNAFGVSQVGANIVIHNDGPGYHDGGVLLAHHA
jgi:hypothetical protein